MTQFPIKRISKIIWILFLGLHSLYNNLSAQSLLDVVHQDKYFLYFEYPKIPESFCEKEFPDDPYDMRGDIYIGVSAKINSISNKVDSLMFYRFYGLGNQFSKDDTLWGQCEENIRLVSKKWVFKTLIDTNINGLTSNGRKLLLRDFPNKYHFIIIKFTNPNGHGEEYSLITKVYLLDTVSGCFKR